MPERYTPRLKQRFRDELVPNLKRELGLSNVMVIDSDGKPARLGKKTTDDGKRVRISRRNGKEL